MIGSFLADWPVHYAATCSQALPTCRRGKQQAAVRCWVLDDAAVGWLALHAAE